VQPQAIDYLRHLNSLLANELRRPWSTPNASSTHPFFEELVKLFGVDSAHIPFMKSNSAMEFPVGGIKLLTGEPETGRVDAMEMVEEQEVDFGW